MKRKALGKGLDALIPPTPVGGPGLQQVAIDEIVPNEFQPRIQFEAEKLQLLADSIAENGVLQPVIVRKLQSGYELVAGERRWRAAQKAGLKTLPAIVQNLSDQKVLELALVENIQRDELSPIEEAHAYQLLVEQFSLSQEEVARRVGRSRTAVANTLRLLKLPQEIQAQVISNDLSMGHARALIPLARRQQLELVREVIARDLSVREVERRVQRLLQPPKPPKPSDPNVRAAQNRLEELWKTRVEIKKKGKKGQISIYFHSDEELEKLYEALLQVERLPH